MRKLAYALVLGGTSALSLSIAALLLERRYSLIDEWGALVLLVGLVNVVIVLPLALLLVVGGWREKLGAIGLLPFGLQALLVLGAWAVSSSRANPFEPLGLSFRYGHPGASGTYTEIDAVVGDTETVAFSFGGTDAWLAFEDQDGDGVAEIVLEEGRAIVKVIPGAGGVRFRVLREGGDLWIREPSLFDP